MTKMFCSQAVWLFLGVLIKSHFSECRFRCTILPGLKNLTKYPSLDMVLNCSFRGVIVDAVNWTRNGQPIKEANILVDPQVNKKWSAVIIAEVTRNQNLGEFKCEATIGRELSSCSASPSKPKLQRFERVKIVESGQSPEMTCRASGWPTPRVSWWRRGSQLRYGDYHHSYILQYSEDYILTMTIIGIEGYHHGTYTCRADNFFGTSMQDINIMVKRNGMIENEYERQFPSVALEGTNTTLECICKVDECKEDTANVYWKSKGHYVNQSARFRLSKRVLANSVTELLMTILNVSKMDAGERLCGINTSLGFEERKRKLRVLEKGRFPRVLSSSKDVSANLQSTVWLKCKTIYPNVLKEPETFWMFNNTLIPKHSQHYKQKDYGSAPGPKLTKILPFELDISNVSTRDFGSYFCGARFKIGEATTNISLSLKRDKNRAHTDYAKPGGPKNSPLVAISSITAGGIIMGFVVAFIAYRLCRNKRNADEPFFETKVNGRQFRYDVFVTFSSQDLNWVRKELIPLVEKHKLNYCIHDRDFEIGKPVVDNMAESVYTSRKVLAVMSHNYMSSKFCRGELEMALYRSTEMGDSSVIVMRIDGVDRNKLPKALRNRTFLDYHDFTERKNWEERLIKHLRPPPIEKCLVDNTGKLYAKLQNTDV